MIGRKRDWEERKRDGTVGEFFLIVVFFKLNGYWIQIRDSQINAIIHAGLDFVDFETLFFLWLKSTPVLPTLCRSFRPVRQKIRQLRKKFVPY